MKKLLLFCTLIFTVFSFSQTTNRIKINGKIIIENNDIDGVVIQNLSSNNYTVTNNRGEFIIEVAINDVLKVSSIIYKDLKLKINKYNLETKSIKIFLIEEVNKLEEIVISTNKLTGNIKTDIKKVYVFKPKLDIVYFGITTKDSVLEEAKNETLPMQSKPMVHGLNIINVVDQLLIPLFRSEVENKTSIGIKEVPVKSIKYYLGSDFLSTNFNIPEHRVEEFIRFVEDKDFDFNLLNYGNELEFLEVLYKKSKIFLAQ